MTRTVSHEAVDVLRDLAAIDPMAVCLLIDGHALVPACLAQVIAALVAETSHDAAVQDLKRHVLIGCLHSDEPAIREAAVRALRAFVDDLGVRNALQVLRSNEHKHGVLDALHAVLKS